MSCEKPPHVEFGENFGLDNSDTAKAEYLQDEAGYYGLRYVDKRNKTKIHVRIVNS